MLHVFFYKSSQMVNWRLREYAVTKHDFIGICGPVDRCQQGLASRPCIWRAVDRWAWPRLLELIGYCYSIFLL
jgi:hypothetical protein